MLKIIIYNKKIKKKVILVLNNIKNHKEINDETNDYSPTVVNAC